ncbi:ranBP-type and C3HC4-type zinc finger-containing protein 1-like [Sabethes cyaneus]|uniref:ranBP-type and C3HC4-type zinc finger-containing protein 1-like n=1 Tax=Sabethes cyaneus TaxID=53552 RepID=UPI00237E3ED4|nr:ranBP-type and C3HC4-type zinc finger-containing protein 1-like [Sabethes cyaneus]
MEKFDKNQYQELLELEKHEGVFLNITEDECFICNNMTPPGEGVMLKNCLHGFCRACIKQSLFQTATMSCPYPNGQFECEGNLLECEVQAILTVGEYQDFLNRLFASVDSDVQPANIEDDANLVVALTDASVLPYHAAFECPVCFAEIGAYKGLIVRDCFHTFCRECLAGSVKHSNDAVVRCPFQENGKACETIIEDPEIKQLVDETDYDVYLKRSLKKAESAAENAFHCKTPNCDGWCIVVDESATIFQCPVCVADNCLRCKAIHNNMTCEEYGDGSYENQLSEIAKKNLVAARVAMPCPKCHILIVKNQGCDGLNCTICKTQICWVTRGPRWGPGGAGDISGGCRCNVNGQKCHPNCANCH